MLPLPVSKSGPPLHAPVSKGERRESSVSTPPTLGVGGAHPSMAGDGSAPIAEPDRILVASSCTRRALGATLRRPQIELEVDRPCCNQRARTCHAEAMIRRGRTVRPPRVGLLPTLTAAAVLPQPKWHPRRRVLENRCLGSRLPTAPTSSPPWQGGSRSTSSFVVDSPSGSASTSPSNRRCRSPPSAPY